MQRDGMDTSPNLTSLIDWSGAVFAARWSLGGTNALEALRFAIAPVQGALL